MVSQRLWEDFAKRSWSDTLACVFICVCVCVCLTNIQFHNAFHWNNYIWDSGKAEKPLICNHTYVYGVPNPHTVNVLFSFFTQLICHSFLIPVMCGKQAFFWGGNYCPNSLWKTDQTVAILPHFHIICPRWQLSILAGGDKVWSRGGRLVFNNHLAGSNLVLCLCGDCIFVLWAQPDQICSISMNLVKLSLEVDPWRDQNQ